MTRTVAALYVQERGCYVGVPGVDPWPESRDARLYAGPHPVVAHPPCSRWCAIAGVVEARWGHKRGDDGGCFAAALASVRRWGGVLEHPAYSKAWPAHDLHAPPRGGGWVRGLCGGWSCHVEQAWYGHPARKATWLYAVRCDLPDLRWGRATEVSAVCSRCANHGGGTLRRLGPREASASPVAFRDILIGIARTAQEAREHCDRLGRAVGAAADAARHRGAL